MSLISLAACSPSIKEGYIVDKHMTESHKETNAYMMGDETIFSDETKPAKYYFDVYGEDENGNGHTVTIRVDEETYNAQKIGDCTQSNKERGQTCITEF